AHFGVPTNGPVGVQVRFADGSVVTHRGVSLNQELVIRDVPADRVCESFPDVPLDFWAYEHIEGCIAAGVVAGYDDARYHGDWAVTRGQMAVFISRSLAGGEGNVPEFTDTPTFSDVPEGYWALKHVEYAVDRGVVAGYDDGTYRPEELVDRGQMAVFVARAREWVGIDDDMTTAPELFPDVPAGFWAGTAVQVCVDNDVVYGYDDGYYHPEYVVTRDQMAVFIARAFRLGL
ncbi:MAG TPA: S-layer homology domain-containing protein, partial [Anaerolineae bacterium]|nr:S-layer homology domain-containing protein [Anaerolineae bacterium]